MGFVPLHCVSHRICESGRRIPIISAVAREDISARVTALTSGYLKMRGASCWYGYRLAQLTMTRRRKDDLSLADFLAAPWWVSTVVGVSGFLFFQWIFPAIGSGNIFLKMLSLGVRPLGYLVGVFFGLIALVVFFRQARIPVATRQSAWSRHTSSEPSFAAAVREPDRVMNTWEEMTARKAEPAPRPTQWSLEVLRLIEWKRFEELAAAFYRELGLRSESIRCGADGGIDAKLFQGDAREAAAIVQCKAWNARPVGLKPVRELLGVMTHHKVPEGIFLTTGDYTNEAAAFARANPIDLINGVTFLGMIHKLPIEAQQKLLAVATEGDFTTPTCPSCGIKTVWRNSNPKGFWGCSNYPKCRVKFFTKSDGG